MRRYEPPDLALFAIFTLVLFVPLAFVDVLGGGMTLAADVRRVAAGERGWPAAVGRAVVAGLCFAVPAAGGGWAAQALAVRWGFRLSGRRPTGPTDDYDDAPARPPG